MTDDNNIVQFTPKPKPDEVTEEHREAWDEALGEATWPLGPPVGSLAYTCPNDHSLAYYATPEGLFCWFCHEKAKFL